MTTSARIVANRRNAQRSTGPRTTRGKARSSKNARRHGLLSTDVVLPEEDAKQYAAFCDDLRESLTPQGAGEELRFSEIVACAWRLQRAHRIEVSLLTYHMAAAREDRADRTAARHTRNPVLEMVRSDSQITDQAAYQLSVDQADAARSARDAEILGAAFLRDAADSDAFSKLSRYELSLVRRLNRALVELERLQAARAEVPD